MGTQSDQQSPTMSTRLSKPLQVYKNLDYLSTYSKYLVFFYSVEISLEFSSAKYRIGDHCWQRLEKGSRET